MGHGAGFASPLCLRASAMYRCLACRATRVEQAANISGTGKAVQQCTILCQTRAWLGLDCRRSPRIVRTQRRGVYIVGVCPGDVGLRAGLPLAPGAVASDCGRPVARGFLCGFPSQRWRIAQGHPSGSQIILAVPPTSRLPTRPAITYADSAKLWTRCSEVCFAHGGLHGQGGVGAVDQ